MIIINNTNKNKINDYIKEMEGKARERLITYDDIIKAIEEVENKLNIPKKHMENTIVNINLHAQQFPRAYRYKPLGTVVDITYQGGKWRLINVYRESCNKYRKYEMILSEETRQAILNKYRKF